MTAHFGFEVPLDWTGPPYTPGSTPTTWLAPDGSATPRPPSWGLTLPKTHGALHETEGEPQPPRVAEPQHLPPVRFTFRLDPTMADLVKIERRVDDVNGGIGETVDLDLAIENSWRAMRDRFELELWPDGRPPAVTAEEVRAQEAELDAVYFAPRNDRDRGVLSRMHMLRDRQRVAAEWAVLILHPPASWEDLITRPLRAGVGEAIAQAYMEARKAAAAASGK